MKTSLAIALWELESDRTWPPSHRIEIVDANHEVLIFIRPVDGDRRRKSYETSLSAVDAKRLASFFYAVAKAKGA